MIATDERELHRLAAMLETIERTLEPASPLREALQKAGLALNLSFVSGLRADIERQFEMLGTPVTDADRAHLRSLGIDPESTGVVDRLPQELVQTHMLPSK